VRAPSLAGAALLCAALAAHADVYVRVDRHGVLQLSDQGGDGYERLAQPSAPGEDLRRMVRETSLRHGVDPRLVEAVIGAESAWDPRAVSAKGAAGLMQLMPQTARRYGVRDRFDPRENIEGGVRYLRDLLELFGGELQLVLAAYNAGEAAVMRAGRAVPPYPESRRYVRRVAAAYAAPP